VQQALAASGLPSQCLELEIAESLFLDRQCSDTLLDLRKLGVRICITDFGAGYSSLSYLKQFPVDTLKIHQTFVDNLDGNPNDLALASAIIAMAHKLGCTAVADGVTTTVQHDLLHTLGCDEYMGPLLGQACSADQLQPLLAGR